jgi:hypothetical protein
MLPTLPLLMLIFLASLVFTGALLLCCTCCCYLAGALLLLASYLTDFSESAVKNSIEASEMLTMKYHNNKLFTETENHLNKAFKKYSLVPIQETVLYLI